MSNRIHLVRTLERLPLLAGRYDQISCVNYNEAQDETRGCFSMVFSARDTLSGKRVALKFYDVATRNLTDKYRVEAFEREPEILKALVGSKRCLQLLGDMDIFLLEVKDAVGNTVLTLPCRYFAVEWIDDEIDKFFHRQQEFSASEKLHLLNEIVLAVEALHRHEVFHRDLKADNLRAYRDALRRIVVAIDLGTAARFSSAPIRDEYKKSVGSPIYAPAEALLGFAGDRRIAPLADVYALGCLLWELFNPGYFGRAVRNTGVFDAATAAIAISIAASNEKDKLIPLRRAMNQFSHAVVPVKIVGVGSTAPPSCAGLLNDLLRDMTRFNFEMRFNSLEDIRAKIWSAIRTIENDQRQRRYAELKQARRENRVEKRILKQERNAAYLVDRRAT